MENETIYMKTKKEGLWEECPAVACLGYMAIGLILFFVGSILNKCSSITVMAV